MAENQESFYETFFRERQEYMEQSMAQVKPIRQPLFSSCRILVDTLDIWWNMVGWVLAMLLLPAVFYTSTLGRALGAPEYVLAALLAAWFVVDVKAHSIPLGTVALGLVMVAIGYRIPFLGMIVIVTCWVGYWLHVRKLYCEDAAPGATQDRP